MLRLEDTSVTRGDFRLTADIAIPKGVTAIIGPSGGGKSTLLDLIAGFITPERGRIIFNDRDITDDPPGKRPVAMLFQDNNLFPHLTALQNVVLGIDTSRKPSQQSLNRAKEALARVDLQGFESRRPADLSGGQQSRVALARVILSDRAVICLDEPFAALGPALRRDMLDLTATHLSDRTVLIVTHDPRDARRIAANTVVVADGKAAPPVPTDALLDNPPEALRSYLG